MLAGLVLVGACTAPPAPPGGTSASPSGGPTRIEVLATTPHDTSAFTEGLELVDGSLYEGTGLEGESQLRLVDPATGDVRQKVDLAPDLFGEGITVVGDRIWQITYRNGLAIQRDRATFREVRRATYTGEGWGLCFDDKRLVMSDGTATLTFRDPTSFAKTGDVAVTKDGKPLQMINELECVGDAVWANVWQTDEIVRIDPATGKVTASVDAGSLRPAGVPRSDVLNGIAAVPGTDEFLVTGKNWPSVFRVRFAE
ncbi:glutamine cyclotransferase [Umezawaea tangerina]|uniref:Glutamine cyclotransferase n=1 Tax=Umezawaea tangerina TaxID=84725 RepID=A0A2T0TLD1_9PSEU|nr:glutamine cyclotransferase [Umezawaea tangerina]